MNWYYASNGHQKGPLPTEDLKSRIAMGEVSPTDLAWREGMADWMPVGSIAELKLEEAPPRVEASVTAVPAPPPEPYRAPAPAPAPAYGAVPVVPSQGMAIGALICGILSLVICCFWPVAIVLAIVAIVLGHISLSKAKSDPQRFGGKGQATGGLVTGYLGLLAAIGILAASMWVATLSPEELEEKVIQRLPEAQRQEFRERMERAKEQQR